MDRLRQLLNFIAAQMSVLTLSQRVAIGLCAALVAGSLLWLLQWSTTPETVPLVSTELTYDDLQIAEEALSAKGVDYNVVGTRIFVREVDRHNALRLLYSAGALPEGSLFDMAAAVVDQNPFQSPEARAFAQNYAKGNELAKILSTYPFVEKASVLINPKTKRRLGGSTDVPTASIAVTLRPGQEMSGEMVEGFARLVAGAVAGLKPFNVNVTDSRTGRGHNVPNPDDAVSFDYLGIVKKHEDRLRAKIVTKLADIPGLRATVTVELDTSKKTTQRFTYHEPQPRLDSSQSSETSAGSQPSEPGVQPNLGTAVTAARRGEVSSTEETKTENFPPQPRETEIIEQGPFALKGVTATVGIPRSFIVGVFQAQYPDTPEEPKDDDPNFATVRTEQIARVQNSVERIVQAKDPQDVQVDVYPDMEWSADGGMWRQAPGGMAAAQVGPEVFDVFGLARTYGPVAGLGTLALMSLFMMMRVVRKSTEMIGAAARAGAEVGEAVEDEGILVVGPHTVGQAEGAEGMLTGKEVDESTLRFQELNSEVTKMVEEDPAQAAELVRRWVEDD